MIDDPPEVREARDKLANYDWRNHVPPEIKAARDLVEAYAQRRKDEQEREWRERNVGALHHIEETGRPPYEDESFSIEFTARLVEADRNEGTMRWDNGVVTIGVWVNDPLKEG